MKNKKIWWIMICALLCTIMFCGCSTQKNVPSTEPSAVVTPTPSPQTVQTAQPTPTPTPMPTPTPDPTLKSGMDSNAVQELQGRLKELGYLKIETCTTKFGPATERAVKLFQKQNGLSADGIAGPATLALVFSADAKECSLPLAGVTIGIDPGHQAKGNSEQEAAAPGSSVTKNKVTSGADGVNTGTPEYKINLAVGLKLRDLLEENGATVVMTHDTADVDISNQQRAKMMNDAGAELVVRLHCDSADASVSGALMLVPSGSYTEDFAGRSRDAGEKILEAFLQATGANNRGISERDDQTGFNWSTVPVCNLEMGCLSNGSEEALLISEEYQQKCAQGICDGILSCF